MLYQRWLETSRRFADRPALYDENGVLTFTELSAAVETRPRATGPVIARSGGRSFFIEILRAWRDGQPVIPVERDASDPVLQCPPPDEARLIKYTPGASGIPRAIFFNDMQVIADADRITTAMNLSPDIPNLAVVSLAHSYGFCNVVLPLILHGIPARLLDSPFPRFMQNAFRQHDALVLPAVPSMWRAWLRAGILTNSPLRLAISAGAPLTLDLEQQVFEETGIKIHNFYGASECGGIAYDCDETPREHIGIVGTPLPGVSVETDCAGRLMVHSDAVAMSYDAPREGDVLGGGHYLTRDLGNVDAKGSLHLTGSSGGAINIAGRKISPARIEAAILTTGHVLRVKVIGIRSADPERHEEIAALVDLVDGYSLTTLKTALTERLALWEIPRHWKVDAQAWQADLAELRHMFQKTP